MVAVKTGTSTWHLDIGASNHINANLNNLSIHLEYLGPNSVAVENGNTLLISHIGSTSFRHNNSYFLLTDVLHVPKTTKNFGMIVIIFFFCFH